MTRIKSTISRVSPFYTILVFIFLYKKILLRKSKEREKEKTVLKGEFMYAKYADFHT